MMLNTLFSETSLKQDRLGGAHICGTTVVEEAVNMS